MIASCSLSSCFVALKNPDISGRPQHGELLARLIRILVLLATHEMLLKMRSNRQNRDRILTAIFVIHGGYSDKCTRSSNSGTARRLSSVRNVGTTDCVSLTRLQFSPSGTDSPPGDAAPPHSSCWCRRIFSNHIAQFSSVLASIAISTPKLSIVKQ